MKSINRKDVAWGYVAQIFNIGAGVILLPFAVRYLPPVELGLWYVFLTLTALAQLLELGFQPTISRQTSYVYSGATEIATTGLPPMGSNLDLRLLANLIAASKKIYKLVALGTAIGLLFFGSLYILTLKTETTITSTKIALPWLIYASGVVLNSYFGYYNGLLQGRGELTEANKIIAISRFSMIAASIPLLISGLGLTGLALASFLSAGVSRLLYKKIFYSPQRVETDFLNKNPGEPNRLVSALWRGSWRLGAVQLGTFLINRANFILASSFLGLITAASYGLTIQLTTLLFSVANMVTVLQAPKMNSAQAEGDIVKVKKLYFSSLVNAWALYLCGCAAIYFAAPQIFHLMNSKTPLLEPSCLAILLATTFLELNHSVSANYIMTLNRVPFLKPALLSGIATLLLGLVAIHFFDLGIEGLLLAQGLVQLSYNNWKWPKEALRHMKYEKGDLVKFGKLGIQDILKSS
ncbi:O-unit flippase-like protein [Crenobacter sp. SG2305]|uniref:O-unit flippase-like protein n=1 Tax=Crenobacter oryzisoli TaxID=3056844 RepID=UPI0025AA3780|nr:O-unit flippase-like protein [Crenobacter sp. SG2305]MDN0084262.1 O-unit flippase-like protein [Crenobacter sp. SG2305]